MPVIGTAATVNAPKKVPSAFLEHEIIVPTGAPTMFGGGTAHEPANVLLKPAPKTPTADPGGPDVGLRAIWPMTSKGAGVGLVSAARLPLAVTP